MNIKAVSLSLPESAWACLLWCERISTGWMLPFSAPPDAANGRLWLEKEGLGIFGTGQVALAPALVEAGQHLRHTLWALHVSAKSGHDGALLRTADGWLACHQANGCRLQLGPILSSAQALRSMMHGERIFLSLLQSGQHRWSAWMTQEQALDWLAQTNGEKGEPTNGEDHRGGAYPFAGAKP